MMACWKSERIMDIALLGIGIMGFATGKRLRESGHEVHAWNRTQEKARRLVAFGAHVHDTPALAVREAGIVICMLESGAVVEDVLFRQGAAAAMKRGALLIDMGSSQPREARDHAARLTDFGVHHLDAPMSGGPAGAAKGDLAIMVGGKAADFLLAQPLLSVLGHATHVGPHGTGQLAKLANQMIAAATLGAVAEALLLCQKGGADMAKVKQAITGGAADSRILQVHGQRMVERDFAPRSRMTAVLNDMRNVLATAEEIGFDAPIAALFEQLYAQGVDHGLTDLDPAGLFVELASRNAMH
jgi:3-hydroxyisobutyrate dehydrogenase-like beta-hydroxyacid dehydrogenase